MTVSMRDPRVQPKSTPSDVPITKLITAAKPINPMVHHNWEASTWLTGADRVMEIPRLPWISWSR